MTVESNNFNYPVSKSSTVIATAGSGFAAYCVTQELVKKAVVSALSLVDQAKDKSEGLKLVLKGLEKFGCDKPTLDFGNRISKIVDTCLMKADETSINQIAVNIPLCASSACALEVFKNFKRTVSAESNQRIFFYDLIEGGFSGGCVGFCTGLGVSTLSTGSKGSSVVTAITGGALGSIGGIIGVISGKTLGNLHLKFFASK